MSQYKEGTANVTNNSNKVYILGDAVNLASNVSIHDAFKRKDEDASYNIIDIDSDGGGEFILISPNYAGATATGVEYQISRDFSPNLALTEINAGDVDWPYHLTVGVIRKLDILLASYSSASSRRLPRIYMGMPEPGREFGEIKVLSDKNLTEVIISTDTPPADTVGLDMAINGAYQSIGLNLAAGSYSNSVTIAKTALVNDVLKFKWTAVPADFPGQNYTIEIKYQDTTVLEIRYEFMRVRFGLAEDGQRIGQGYKPSVKSRFFGGMVTAQGPPLGADLKIAIMHQDVQKTQALKLTAGSTSEYTSFAQLDCLSTETLDTIITQVGSEFPGDMITVTLYSYKIT